MDSGECEVAPSTPKPPARLTAATTSRQWLKASKGNSIPSMSQIGDFMIVLTPRRQLFGAARALFEFSEFADDASASWVRMPSAGNEDGLILRSGLQAASRRMGHVPHGSRRRKCASSP